MNKQYLRPAEVEEEFGIKVSMQYKLFKNGLKSTVIRHNPKGRGVRLIKRSDLEAFLAAREVSG